MKFLETLTRGKGRCVLDASNCICGLMECNDDRAYRTWMFRCNINCFHMLEIDGMVPEYIPFICGLLACRSKGVIGKG